MTRGQHLLMKTFSEEKEHSHPLAPPQITALGPIFQIFLGFYCHATIYFHTTKGAAFFIEQGTLGKCHIGPRARSLRHYMVFLSREGL